MAPYKQYNWHKEIEIKKSIFHTKDKRKGKKEEGEEEEIIHCIL